MSQKINLFDRPWTLQSWRPYAWFLQNSAETDAPFCPEHGPYDAVLPGSVQTTLLRHGVIKDWNVGLNSLDCEWVEHRHWEFSTEIKAGEIPVRKSQQRQADFLALAIGACKQRFPRCSGFLIWMGHDCMPVGSNTSIINYDGAPKPAYHAIKKEFLK